MDLNHITGIQFVQVHDRERGMVPRDPSFSCMYLRLHAIFGALYIEELADDNCGDRFSLHTIAHTQSLCLNIQRVNISHDSYMKAIA